MSGMCGRCSHLFFFIVLEYSCFIMLCQFQVYSKVNQLYIYRYPVFLFLRFFSHIGHYRVLSRVPCAIQQVLISYLLYIQQCVYVNPNLPIYPSPPYPLVTISLLSTSVTQKRQISYDIAYMWNLKRKGYKWTYLQNRSRVKEQPLEIGRAHV